MRTAATEYLSHTQIMSRLGATFGALIHEQVAAVRRYLEDDPGGDATELYSIAELAVRLVERSAEWLEVDEVAKLALEMREALAQMGQLRPVQRQEIVAQCRVALEAEERLVERLRADGFATLVEHAGIVNDALEALRSNRMRARMQESSSARNMIDESAADVGTQENLLALTFEIKSSLVHQNERIGAMTDVVGSAIEAVQSAISESDAVQKATDRQGAGSKGGASSAMERRSLILHQRLQETEAGLNTLSHELNQLLSLQYALERRARDLDEHLLWEFLDPLDRYLDDIYSAAQSESVGRRVSLSVQTGGVGFEPEIGAVLLPMVLKLLETMKPMAEGADPLDVRLAAAREGLEARIQIEGAVSLDPEARRHIEVALEGLGGFATHQEKPGIGTMFRIQFPMARSLRSFLIVEAAGQRIALPWSAIERIYASDEEPGWDAAHGDQAVFSLGSLFEREDAGAPDSIQQAGRGALPDGEGENPRPAGHPIAVLRSGSGSAVVSFDRLVWRENARLKPLPPKLYPVEEVLGGIMSTDAAVTLVLNPASILKRIQSQAGPGGVA